MNKSGVIYMSIAFHSRITRQKGVKFLLLPYQMWRGGKAGGSLSALPRWSVCFSFGENKKPKGKARGFFGAPLFKINKAKHAGSVIPGQLIVTCPGAGGAREISRAEQGEFQGRGRSQKGERRGYLENKAYRLV